MSSKTLSLIFGLALAAASTTTAYCAYETSQIVLKTYYIGFETTQQI